MLAEKTFFVMVAGNELLDGIAVGILLQKAAFGRATRHEIALGPARLGQCERRNRDITRILQSADVARNRVETASRLDPELIDLFDAIGGQPRRARNAHVSARLEKILPVIDHLGESDAVDRTFAPNQIGAFEGDVQIVHGTLLADDAALQTALLCPGVKHVDKIGEQIDTRNSSWNMLRQNERLRTCAAA